MRNVHMILFVTMALIHTSCLSTLLGTKETRSRDYKMPLPGPGWEAIDPAESDAAYRNSVDKAILNVSSQCGGERYRALEDLSEDVLKQLPENTIKAPAKAQTIGGHPGLVTAAEGMVDGEPLNVQIAVIRTPTCIYDIILAGRSLDQTSRAAFDQALAGFSDGSKQ